MQLVLYKVINKEKNVLVKIKVGKILCAIVFVLLTYLLNIKTVLVDASKKNIDIG